MENNERLKGEISLLKSKLEVERSRYGDLQALAEHSKLQAQRELDAKNELSAALKADLADAKRYQSPHYYLLYNIAIIILLVML